MMFNQIIRIMGSFKGVYAISNKFCDISFASLDDETKSLLLEERIVQKSKFLQLRVDLY